MIRFFTFVITLLASVICAQAQTTAKIIDSLSKNAIPYATIHIAGQDLVSNNEGYFTLPAHLSESNEPMEIRYIGYKPVTITVSDLKSLNNTIVLEEGSYEITGITISNTPPNTQDIIRLMRENLVKNHKTTDYHAKIFMRQSVGFTPKLMDIEIKKSTGYSKSDLKKVNEDIQKFTNIYVNQTSKSYQDKLMDYYRATTQVEGKATKKSAIVVQKSIKLSDANKSTSYEDIEKNIKNHLQKHLDTTKFYRVKSGLFGSRDTVSLSKSYNEKKEAKTPKKEAKNNTVDTRHELEKFITENSLYQHTDFTFLHKPEIYTYNFVEYSFFGDDLVYVIEFKPKKSKAEFTGKLFINAEDYGIYRVDYKLVEGKVLDGINLKLLLGIKFRENHLKGSIQFKKHTDQKYHIAYAAEESGIYFYFNRPLKFIELKDKNRDELAFNIKVEGNVITKTEFLNLQLDSTTAEQVSQIQETSYQTQKISKYDPAIWKGYSIIEPVQEMKRFQAEAQ